MIIFPVSVYQKNGKFVKKPKVKSWQKYESSQQEIEESINLGVSPVDGLVVFDVDTYKGITTKDIDEKLGVQLDWELAFLQKTPSGGEHYVFSTNRPIKQGTDLLGLEGFDSRCSGKGWITIGEGYSATKEQAIEVLSGVDEFSVGYLPEEVIDKLSSDTQQSEEFSDDLTAVLANTPIDLDHPVEYYIDELTNDHASLDWLTVGMAIYHQTEGSEYGWKLFDEFSKKAPDQYDHDMNRRRWDSFSNDNNSNPVTFASVIKLVGKKEVNCKNVVKKLERAIGTSSTVSDIEKGLISLKGEKLDDFTKELLVKTLQEKYEEKTGIPLSRPVAKNMVKKLDDNGNDGSYLSDYVFLSSNSRFLHRKRQTPMDCLAFNMNHSHMTPLDGDGNPQSASNYAIGRIETVDRQMYWPPAYNEEGVFESHGIKYLNTYKPSALIPDIGDGSVVERVKNHIAHLLADPFEKSLVVDFLAHNVQKPGVKIPWAIVLQGVEGDGKSFFRVMMGLIMGENGENIGEVSTTDLSTNFQSWAEGNCLTFMEEIKITGADKYKVLNDLKPYITNPKITVTRKGVDPVQVHNTANYFCLTNFKDAIPIGDNDRRYCVLFSQWQSKEKLQEFNKKNPDYYPDIYKAIKSKPEQILYWLLNHKISEEFLSYHRAPETSAKSTMIESSKSIGTIELENALEDNPQVILENGSINVTLLQKIVTEERANPFGSKYQDFPKTSELNACLANKGYTRKGRRMVDGVKCTLYTKS